VADALYKIRKGSLMYDDMPISMQPGFNPETPGREYESRQAFYFYTVILPVANDLPALSVISLRFAAPDKDEALTQAIETAESLGYIMHFDNRVAVIESSNDPELGKAT
jgi:hypothetical protein